ncbi:MAG TPA: RagB/SusD family nutrient uptake outer membrane protein [Gemmatimonadaceae bacterium]|nr:RagB/SusD family nutrient uptake outer membrane protein [Gemmatimonadaceae bacterium]
MTPSTLQGRTPRAMGAAYRLARHVAAAALLTLPLVACSDEIDQLLSAESPARLSESGLLQPSNAALLVASSVADLECALGSYIVAGGLAAGELVDATQTASRWSYDRREVLPTDAHYSTFSCEGLGVYTPINTARHTNDQATKKLEEWTDQQVANRQRFIATTAAMAGYATLYLGEGFCSATINVGPELTSDQVFDSAVVRFTKAITAATAANDQNVLNLARVGRARAYLDRGNKAAAAADAGGVPVSFVYNAEHNTLSTRRQNRVFTQNNQGLAVTIAAPYRNLTVQGVADPRVRITNANRLASDQVNPLYTQNKYGSLTAPTPIATGIEAQLILAEAQGGASGISILNALRARAGVALPPLTAAEEAAFATTLAEERNRELFLQGNRWYDLKRLNLPQVPAAGTPYAKGGTYGNQRCWPLPDAEKLANPNF